MIEIICVQWYCPHRLTCARWRTEAEALRQDGIIAVYHVGPDGECHMYREGRPGDGTERIISPDRATPTGGSSPAGDPS